MKTLSLQRIGDYLDEGYVFSDETAQRLKEWIDRLPDEEVMEFYREDQKRSLVGFSSILFDKRTSADDVREAFKDLLYEDAAYLERFFLEYGPRLGFDVVLESAEGELVRFSARPPKRKRRSR